MLGNALQQTEKTKYHVDGIGGVTRVLKTRWKLPQGIDNNKKLIDYFLKEGENEAATYLTCNSNKLNSYLKRKYEEAQENGVEFDIPGIDEPTVTETISFRKS